MRAFIFSLLFLPLATLGAPVGLTVNGGAFRLDGGSVRSEALVVGAEASLAGNGVFHASLADLRGSLSPCGEHPAETGTLAFTGSVRLDGAYHCKINGHEDVDLVSSAGPIAGIAAIAIQKQSGAIPLGQTILSGNAASEVSGFVLNPDPQAGFRLEERPAGALVLTDLVGDTDADGLPDWWEYAYYTNRTMAMPDGDEDGDRSLNLHELGAGTDPRDPASVFVIVHADGDGGHRLFWNSVSGKTYAIHGASAPGGDYEELAAGIGAEAPVNGWTNAVPGPFPLFYQVRIAR